MDLKLGNFFSLNFNSSPGVEGFEEKLLSASDRSGRDRLRFSLDFCADVYNHKSKKSFDAGS